MKNIHIFVPPLDENAGVLPITWAILKTYYEHRGSYREMFNWVEPNIWVINQPVDDIIADIAKNPPSVFGFGGYVWNINLCYEVSRRVKELWPDCVIVAGGPQPEYKTPGWFAEHPYIDIVVPADGEVPFTAILDRVAQGRKNWSTVPDVVLPAPGGSATRSLTTVPVKDFTWPASPILEQSSVLKKYIAQSRDQHKEVHLMWETNRGCPYQCTFCDWGGGIYTKVRLKPLEFVLAELDWVAENQVDYLNIVDANIGMFPRDVDIVRYLCELSKRTGYPHKLYTSNAKQNKDRVIEIQRMFKDANLLQECPIHVQDLSHEVLKHIRRIDVPWNKNLEHIRELHKHNIQTYLVSIMGLPGWTKEIFIADIDEICTHNLNYPRGFSFLLLPNSPAADPEYIDEHKIKTIRRSMDVWPVMLKDPGQATTGVRVVKNTRESRVEHVIETKWYSKEDLLECRTINGIVYAGETAGVLKYITRWLWLNQKVKYSDFYIDLYNNFFPKAGPTWRKLFDHFQNHMRHWYKDPNTYFEVDSPLLNNFPFRMNPELYWAFHSICFHSELHNELSQYLVQRYTNHEEFVDIIRYNNFVIIDLDYNSEQGRTETFEYNWSNFLSTGQTLKHSVTCQVTDQTFYYGSLEGTPHLMQWHRTTDPEKRALDFFYTVGYGIKSPRFFNKINNLAPVDQK